MRGILVGVTEGRFRGDSRSEEVDDGCFNAGEPLMDGKPVVGRLGALPLDNGMERVASGTLVRGN